MERLDYGSPQGSVIEKPTRKRSSSKKRKWRQIEAIQEEKRLLKELQGIDFCKKDNEVYEF